MIVYYSYTHVKVIGYPVEKHSDELYSGFLGQTGVIVGIDGDYEFPYLVKFDDKNVEKKNIEYGKLYWAFEHLQEIQGVSLMYEIKLEYFKESGKYYTEGVYSTDLEHVFEIVEEVKLLREQSMLPGIDCWEGYIYLNTEQVPNGYPVIIKPLQERYKGEV